MLSVDQGAEAGERIVRTRRSKSADPENTDAPQVDSPRPGHLQRPCRHLRRVCERVRFVAQGEEAGERIATCHPKLVTTYDDPLEQPQVVGACIMMARTSPSRVRLSMCDILIFSFFWKNR